MPFQLPSDGLRFYGEIVDRSLSLISTGIWSGIHPARLRTWVNNFSSDLEKYFCACLLDSLIYRSDDQSNALVTQIFQRSLPDLARVSAPPIGVPDDWLDICCGTTDPGLRLIPVLKPSDPAGKSGDVLARLLKRGFRVHPSVVIEPKQARAAFARGITTFVFVDDFLGTGNQFLEMIMEAGLQALIASAYCVYAPLAAHASGIGFLAGHLPSLHIASGELIDSSHSVFSPTGHAFADGVNTQPDALSYYHSFLETKGLALGKGRAHAPGSSSMFIPDPIREGYGGLQLAYAFSHSVPDNCLPVFWWSKVSSWSPLFNR